MKSFLFLLLSLPLSAMDRCTTEGMSYGPDEDAPGIHRASTPLPIPGGAQAAINHGAGAAYDTVMHERLRIEVPPSDEEVMGQLRTDLLEEGIISGEVIESRVPNLSFFEKYDDKGNTIFHRLIAKGRIAVFMRMLEWYAEVCGLEYSAPLKPNIIGWTPLHCAASYGEDKIVHEILRFNPFVARQRDPQGNTALHFALYGMLGCLDKEFLIEHDKVAKLAKYKALIIELEESGCRFEDLNRGGISPHELAMRNPTTQRLYDRIQRVKARHASF